VELMMDVKVEALENDEVQAKLAVMTPDQIAAEVLASVGDTPARDKVPTLDDVMDETELAQVTAEGLAANPERTPEQVAEDNERASQMAAYQNYLKQQYFQQFMMHRPVPATARAVDWALLRYEVIVHEKKEFDHDPAIKALNEQQWYHGIITGNIHISRTEDDNIVVSLRVPYVGHTLNLQYTPEQLAQQRMAAERNLPRAKRREIEAARAKK
jgi:hypothetical protein